MNIATPGARDKAREGGVIKPHGFKPEGGRGRSGGKSFKKDRFMVRSTTGKVKDG